MTDRTHLMTAALSMTPTAQLAAYTTSQLRDAALDAEPQLLEQMAMQAALTEQQKIEWMDRVRALNVITTEVQRRRARDLEAGPSYAGHEDGYRLTNVIMCF